MSELETVNKDGKIYQIGAVYEFSHDGRSWFAGRLTGVDGIYFNAGFSDFGQIRKCQSPIGTITNAPIELEDGEWYMCHWQKQTGSESFVWITEPFRCNKKSFLKPDGSSFFEPLYKMVKA